MDPLIYYCVSSKRKSFCLFFFLTAEFKVFRIRPGIKIDSHYEIMNVNVAVMCINWQLLRNSTYVKYLRISIKIYFKRKTNLK